MSKEDVQGWIGCLIWIIAIVLLYKGCDWYELYKDNKQRKEKIEAQRQDSIRKAFIADSLARDPHYQDSVKKAKEAYRIWKIKQDSIKREEIVGFVYGKEDSVYHSTFHAIESKDRHNFSVYDRPKLRFITRSEVDSIDLCDICADIDDIYYRYTEGELKDIYDE